MITDRRIKLESHNLVEMCRFYTLEELAIKFSCSVMMVSDVATNQFKRLQINKFENSELRVKFDGLEGAWMKSKEREFYKQLNK